DRSPWRVATLGHSWSFLGDVCWWEVVRARDCGRLFSLFLGLFHIVTGFGRCLVPRPGNVVPIRGSGSKRVSVPFKVGSCPGLKGVAAPLLADLIGIRRLRTVDWCGFCYT